MFHPSSFFFRFRRLVYNQIFLLSSSFKGHDLFSWHIQLHDACVEGRWDDVRDWLENSRYTPIISPSDWSSWSMMMFRDTCRRPDSLDMVRYFLTSPSLDPSNLSLRMGLGGLGWIHDQETLVVGFYSACSSGNLELVRYFLESPDLCPERDTAYGHLHWVRGDDIFEGFLQACGSGSLEVVQYLLTSPQADQFLSPRTHSGWVDWQDHACDGLRLACQKNRHPIVHWLVMDYQIPMLPSVLQMTEHFPKLAELFVQREALFQFQELEKTLPLSDQNLPHSFATPRRL